MTLLDRGMGGVLAVAALAGLAWASNAPMTAHRAPDAVLRLAWSARPERIETCRQLSEDELARLPQHMRQPVVCEGTTAEYRLVVRHEGEVVADYVVRGGGLRQDRRLYVFHELRVPAGDAAIEVRFDRLDSGAAGKAAAKTVPPQMALQERLRFRPREVTLVTYDPERQALVVVQRTP